MFVTIELATESQHGDLIRNLNQLYVYEFARFDPAAYTNGQYTERHRPDENDYLFAFSNG